MIGWIRVDRGIGDDPKLYELAERTGLDVDAVIGKLIRVFAKMAEHAKDGDLSTVTDTALEEWARWKGRKGRFAKAFRDLLAPTGTVTAWEKHNGAAIEKAERDARRLADRRASDARPSRDRSASVAGNGTLRDEGTSLPSSSARDERDTGSDGGSRVTPPESPDLPPHGRLTVAANQGTEAGLGAEQPSPFPWASGEAVQLAELCRVEEIPLDVATAAVFAAAERHAVSKGARPRTMAYFKPAIREAWAKEQARRAQAGVPTPAPLPEAGGARAVIDNPFTRLRLEQAGKVPA